MQIHPKKKRKKPNLKPMKSNISSIVLILLILVSTCAAEEKTSTIGTLKSEIDKIVQPLVESNTNIGVAAGVLVGDQKLVRGYGKVIYGMDRKPDGDTVYEIGSISKVFTATLLAQMVREEKLKLDDPIESYLPKTVKVPVFEKRKITLQDLATHVSGLPRLPTNFVPKDWTNPYADYTVENLYDFLSNHKLRRKPGETYEYSNLGVGLLGHVLARKNGKSYEQLLIERICEPLGMNSTRITLSPELQQRLAPAYTTHGVWKLRIYLPNRNWNIPTLAGAGAIRSTVNDLLKFISANMGITKTNLKGACDLAHQERFKQSDMLKLGLGWHILHFEDVGKPIYWHNGGTGGYRTFLGFIKEKKIGVVLLSNTQSSVDSAALELLLVLHNIVKNQ
jgi:serine-type D-Ala-D-Ala carboxypeptidase/endopeptidase